MDLENYKKILDDQIIENYLNFSSKKADAIIVTLAFELKKIIKKEQYDNKIDYIRNLLNTFIYKVNCLIKNNDNDILEKSLEDSKFMNKKEKENLKELLNLLKEIEYDPKKVSEIYLYLNTLLFLQIQTSSYMNKLMKKDECLNKGYYYDIDTKTFCDLKNGMIQTTEDISRMKKKVRLNIEK